MLGIFSCVYWPSVLLLWTNVSLGLCPFFNWAVLVFLLLSYMSYLYIWEIKPLSVAPFADIFSHSVALLCVCVRVHLLFPLLCKTCKLGPVCSFLLLFLLPWGGGS